MRVLRKMRLRPNPSRPLEIIRGKLIYVLLDGIKSANTVGFFFFCLSKFPHEGFIMYLREDVFCRLHHVFYIYLLHWFIELIFHFQTYILMGLFARRNLDGLKEYWRNLWEKNTVPDEKKKRIKLSLRARERGKYLRTEEICFINP